MGDKLKDEPVILLFYGRHFAAWFDFTCPLREKRHCKPKQARGLTEWFDEDEN